jgi:hypothetical protein
MDSNKKGNIGLIKIIDDLVENNFFPFLPFTDTTIVDLVVSNENMELKKFQIKYKKIDKFGCINLSTQRVIDRKKVDTDLTKFDYYGVYCPDNKKTYYIPTSVFVNKKMIKLRVIEPKQKQKNMIFALDYEKKPNW